MKTSVVVCMYSMDRYGPFSECVESVLAQTCEPLEIIIIVDGNQRVFERVSDSFDSTESIRIHYNGENPGISHSRTRGLELAPSGVVAFIDDDATADSNWAQRLGDVYESTDTIAVSGDVRPNWQTASPSFFPAELY